MKRTSIASASPASRPSRCSPRRCSSPASWCARSKATATCWSRTRRATAARPTARCRARRSPRSMPTCEKDEGTTDWLAKLHGIGAATGCSCAPRATRRCRPKAASCATRSCCRCRAATARSATSSSARAEIPVMSVDQLTLKREQSGSERRQRDPGRDAPHSAHGEVMNLRFNLSPWKKNAAIVAAAVTVVAGVVAGRERPRSS